MQAQLNKAAQKDSLANAQKKIQVCMGTGGCRGALLMLGQQQTTAAMAVASGLLTDCALLECGVGRDWAYHGSGVRGSKPGICYSHVCLAAGCYIAVMDFVAALLAKYPISYSVS